MNTGVGNDRLYLEGKGEKRIWGEFGRDTFIITKQFSSAAKTSTVIVDFEANIPRDIIDVSQFSNIRSLMDLKIEQYVDEGDNKFVIIKVAEDKEIVLYNVGINQLHESSFIFSQVAETF